MKAKMLDRKTKNAILTAQRNEITEHFIYEKLSQSIEDPHNKNILKRISRDELEHYHFWKRYTNEDVKPDKLKILKYFFISKILGITFGTKLMERGEEKAHAMYENISKSVPAAKSVVKDEVEHEKQLIDLIDEERLRYIGSVILGLNDALVELTGALAGLTLALQNTRLVAMAGLITGIAASLSMAASEYLSTKTEEGTQNPFKASIYTGSAYVLTVLFLIFPYFLFKNLYFCLGFAIFNAIIVIFIFTFYISVAKDISFKKRFSEMALISLGIAALTFGIGFLLRIFLNIDV
ncbi:MAG: VIT1/CCC1 transporter family protein [Candidatus Methanofastidiosia archaeon]